MMRLRNGAAIATAVLLVACQGGFSNGTSTPGGAVLPPGPAGPSPAAAASASANPQSASGTAGSGVYPFSQAAAGFQCPTDQGFSCVLKFNVPPSTPTPVPTATPTAKPQSSSKRNAKGKGKKSVAQSSSKRATPSPSPSPSPSPNGSASPSGSASPVGSAAPAGSGAPAASASPAASATPAGPTVTIKLEALPKDAPAMTNPDPKAVATEPLLAVRVTVDADVTLDGAASADFTLPQEQIGGRGFAIQLFSETHHKKKTSDTYLGSYSQSTLSGTTLHFGFTPPMVTVKKGETWLFVLYGDDRPSATAAPSPSGAPSTPPSGAPESPAPSSTATAQP